ncbi:helix-turn-helix domain-containing protein [Actinobacillus equuli subsp. equuli]|uniref:Helix-turn-helix domain-containing protein n=1 Tax=Actinobacillus equuli subsp. equuli TaxID=202947 RepID=A0A9X4G5S4_ACTEU|nr:MULTISPECIES: S24 family peptidase [Actinobacillus]MDE8035751.1 helix-turn-helix domain-containing protein [Actinobacillus equuli subsp. equuli]
MNTKPIGEKIKDLRNAQKLSQKELADLCGKLDTRKKGSKWGQSRIGNYETSARVPDLDDIRIIATVLKTEPSELAFGSDELEIIGKPKDGIIPVVGEAAMGRDETVRLEELRTGYINLYSADPDAYAVRGKGSSMEPRIKSGEYIVIEPNTPAMNGDDVLICTTSGQYMIKTLDWHRDGEYRFSSINNSHPPFNLPEHEVVNIHTVGAIVKASRFTAFETIDPVIES